MSTVDDIQNAARDRLRGANQLNAQAENEMREAVAQGAEARLSKSEIARLSGMSRPTIIAWIKPKSAPAPSDTLQA